MANGKRLEMRVALTSEGRIVHDFLHEEPEKNEIAYVIVKKGLVKYEIKEVSPTHPDGVVLNNTYRETTAFEMAEDRIRLLKSLMKLNGSL